MSLVPLDKSGQLSLYSDNIMESFTNPSIIMSSYAPKTEYPLDPNNDLLPPGFSSPMVDMKFGPPEQTVKRYFSLTVNDIDNYQKNKIKKWIKVYEKVLGGCFRKIREHFLRDQRFCFFPVPEYMVGFPLYNLTHCTCFIIKKLKESGFKTTFVPPNVIYIYWPVKNHYEHVITPPKQKIVKPPKRDTDVHYIQLGKNVQPTPPMTRQINPYSYQQEEPFLFN